MNFMRVKASTSQYLICEIDNYFLVCRDEDLVLDADGAVVHFNSIDEIIQYIEFIEA